MAQATIALNVNLNEEQNDAFNNLLDKMDKEELYYGMEAVVKRWLVEKSKSYDLI